MLGLPEVYTQLMLNPTRSAYRQLLSIKLKKWIIVLMQVILNQFLILKFSNWQIKNIILVFRNACCWFMFNLKSELICVIFSQFLVTKDTKGEMELFDRMFQKVTIWLNANSNIFSTNIYILWISIFIISNQLFLQSKLYMVPGSMFGCEKPGWFRIIFAVTPER